MKYWQIDDNIDGMLLTFDIPFKSKSKYRKKIMKIFDKVIKEEEQILKEKDANQKHRTDYL